jgi:nucleotide-binding universal stress UspA family protein
MCIYAPFPRCCRRPVRAFQALQPELLVPEGMSAEERAQAQQIVSAAVREIRRLVTSPDVSISGRIVVSERVEEGMLHETRETKADMIVVGTRGLSPLRGAIMGSVSHALIEKAECPVLVVK